MLFRFLTNWLGECPCHLQLIFPETSSFPTFSPAYSQTPWMPALPVTGNLIYCLLPSLTYPWTCCWNLLLPSVLLLAVHLSWYSALRQFFLHHSQLLKRTLAPFANSVPQCLFIWRRERKWETERERQSRCFHALICHSNAFKSQAGLKPEDRNLI